MDQVTNDFIPSETPSISIELAADEQLDIQTNSHNHSPHNRTLKNNDVSIEEESSEIVEPSECKDFIDLYSYTLNQVSLEPSLLSGLKNQLLRQQEEMTIKNRTTLIETCDQLNEISSEVS